MSIIERLLLIPGRRARSTSRGGMALTTNGDACASTTADEPCDVLVALSGTALDRELIALACAAAREGHAAIIHAIYGIQAPRARAVDDELPAERARAEAALARAADDARARGVAVAGEYIQSRDVGESLVRVAAASHRHSLLILGLASRAEGSDEPEESNPASYALKYAPCRVWVVRGL